MFGGSSCLTFFILGVLFTEAWSIIMTFISLWVHGTELFMFGGCSCLTYYILWVHETVNYRFGLNIILTPISLGILGTEQIVLGGSSCFMTPISLGVLGTSAERPQKGPTFQHTNVLLEVETAGIDRAPPCALGHLPRNLRESLVNHPAPIAPNVFRNDGSRIAELIQSMQCSLAWCPPLRL